MKLMREIPKMLGGLLLVALLLAHLFLIALFFAPVPKLLGLVIESNSGFLVASEIPEAVEFFLTTNKVGAGGDFTSDASVKSKLVMGILMLRQERFMDDTERLALNMNLLDFGEGIIGMKAASEHYYKKSLMELSDKEWITLVNLQKIFSKK
jgi:hypothetical protein